MDDEVVLSGVQGNGVSFPGSMNGAVQNVRSQKKILLLLLLRRLSEKWKRQRSFRVHPLWRRRRELGVHSTLVKEMAMCHHTMFFNYTRMSTSMYEKLLLKVGYALQSYPTRPDALSASEKLMVTLRFLATGETFTSLSLQFRMGISTVEKAVNDTLQIIWTSLQPEVLKLPNSVEEWRAIIADFDEKWQFPNCFGAMDGKQVMMQAQPHTGSDYYNYKNFHSINLLAMCDANYNFIVIDVGGKGRQSDGGVFKHSQLYIELEEGRLNLPSASSLLPGGPKLPQIIIADAAFPLTKYCMRPFPGAGTGLLSVDKNIYNYRHSRARRVIESTLGIMVSRFRVFRTPIMVKLSTTKLIVLGATCLHNFIKKEEQLLSENDRQYCPQNFGDKIVDGYLLLGEWRKEVFSNALEDMPVIDEESYSGHEIRNYFKEYFLGPGKVPWQASTVWNGAI